MKNLIVAREEFSIVYAMMAYKHILYCVNGPGSKIISFVQNCQVITLFYQIKFF